MNGAGLIAFTITAALYGIISGQILAYLRRNCRDRLALKVMVGFLRETYINAHNPSHSFVQVVVIW